MTDRTKSCICVLALFFIFIAAFLYQCFSSNYIQTDLSLLFKKNDEIHSSSSGNINADNKFPTENEQKKIALTFDDGPHPKYTLKLLDGLKSRNVKATFFLLGANATNHPEIVKRIYDDGHLIGNHTFSHVQLTCISKDKAIDEINMTNEAIKNSTGVYPQYIRPPYGLYSEDLKTETNLIPVLWSVDPRDWSVLNTDSVVNHVIKRVKNGDIILLHDIFDTSVDAALIIIDKLKEQGYEFVMVDQLMPLNN